jgi:hypothetical protein
LSPASSVHLGGPDSSGTRRGILRHVDFASGLERPFAEWMASWMK